MTTAREISRLGGMARTIVALRPLMLAIAAAFVASALVPAAAGAAIPVGNLLGNPGGESDAGVTNATSHVCPVQWDCPIGFPTSVRYTAGGGFPTTAQAPSGGGKNFFAGGPLHPPPDQDQAYISQGISLAPLGSDVAFGNVQATVSGWLGGFESQDDSARIGIAFYSDAAGANPIGGSGTSTPFVKPADRASKTGFRFRSATTAIPGNAQLARVAVVFSRDTAAGPYNDGYADNVSLCLSRAGSDPARACSPPATGGSTPAPGDGGRTILGGPGDSTLRGTPGDDVILCGDGDDTVIAGAGDDFVDCKGGDDVIDAGAGNDRVRAGAGEDRIRGGRGRDRIRAQAGADRAGGGSGGDRITGGSGGDRLFGNSGRDRLFGNSGRDRLRGGSGRDRLFGGTGRDRLLGGKGLDRLFGGPGRDRARQ